MGLAQTVMADVVLTLFPSRAWLGFAGELELERACQGVGWRVIHGRADSADSVIDAIDRAAAAAGEGGTLVVLLSHVIALVDRRPHVVLAGPGLDGPEGPSDGFEGIVACSDLIRALAAVGGRRVVLVAEARSLDAGLDASALAIEPLLVTSLVRDLEANVGPGSATSPLVELVQCAAHASEDDLVASLMTCAEGSKWVRFEVDGAATEAAEQADPRAERSMAGPPAGPPPAAHQDDPSPIRPLVDDDVCFTVHRPRAVDTGRWHDLVVLAHKTDLVSLPDGTELDPVAQAEERARALMGPAFDPQRAVRAESGVPLAAGNVVTVVPSIPGIQFNPPSQTFEWREPVHEARFRFTAGADLDGQRLKGQVSVLVGILLAAQIDISIVVDRNLTGPAPAPPTTVTPYRKIFVSYSHKDLGFVRWYQESQALGDEYLRDQVTLRTGERWNPRLLQLIDEADIFQLFWSERAASSRYVRQEVDHALGLGREQFVRPVVWEDPPPEMPPSLSEFHYCRLRPAMAPPPPPPSPGPPGGAPLPAVAQVGVTRAADGTESHEIGTSEPASVGPDELEAPPRPNEARSARSLRLVGSAAAIVVAAVLSVAIVHGVSSRPDGADLANNVRPTAPPPTATTTEPEWPDIEDPPEDLTDYTAHVQETGETLLAVWSDTSVDGRLYRPPAIVTFTGDDEEMPTCGRDEVRTGDMFFCRVDNSIVLDTERLYEADREIGDAYTWVVVAHEVGHSAQLSFALPDEPELAEPQADCFAGASMQLLVDEGVIELQDEDGEEIERTLEGAPDRPRAGARDIPAEQRRTAFEFGRDQGADACLETSAYVT